ncbi:MAG: hypothetical protein EXR11_14175 [Rhodospirillaceae bacterium]|nr:hypothetical protein [Rhodospirillaceae bacterium]
MSILNISRLFGAVLAIALLGIWAGNSAFAETIKIGLIDFALRHESFKAFKGVTVRSITFETSALRPARMQSAAHIRGHGDVMAAELIEAFQAASPDAELELFVASPFLEDPATGRQTIDYIQLEFAYIWLARQGVKIVAQTFVAKASPALETAIAAATREGLVILTSAGNGPQQNAVPPFPASYGNTIGISTTGLSGELSLEENRNTYVRYSVPAPAISGLKLRQDPELGSLAGSSRATVAAAGLLGALTTRYRLETREDALLLLDTLAVSVADYGQQKVYGLGVLVTDVVAQHVRSSLTPPQLKRLLRDERLSA